MPSQWIAFTHSSPAVCVQINEKIVIPLQDFFRQGEVLLKNLMHDEQKVKLRIVDVTCDGCSWAFLLAQLTQGFASTKSLIDKHRLLRTVVSCHACHVLCVVQNGVHEAVGVAR
jgi:hypothetical protein